MPEERLLSVGVECYAGYRGEQTPRTLISVTIGYPSRRYSTPGWRPTTDISS